MAKAAERIPAWDTEMVQLGEGIYAYIQATGAFCISNAGLLCGPDTSVAIDALFVPRMTRAFLAEVAKVNATPIEILVNTHHHVDHTYGNQFFAGHTIIGHRLTRTEMQRVGNPSARISAAAPHFAADLAEPVTIVPPNLTYEQELTLHIGDREARLFHVPTAHTIDDTLVYLPAEKLLFTGDIAFLYVTPLAFEGSVLGWIAAIREVLAMDVERIIPGHGPIGDKDDLRLQLAYFELLRDEARRRYDAGLPVEQAVLDIDIGPYRSWGEPERLVPNVMSLYQEFAGGPWQPVPFQLRGELERAWLERHER